MTVGPFDTRHPETIEAEAEKERRKLIKECSHAAQAGTIQLYDDKIVAECADCPAEELIAEKIDIEYFEDTREIVVLEWGLW